MEAVTVEVLSRFGQVRARHRLTRFPATLGRKLDCDVVLDEPDVSALHARVERAEDGSLTLVDAGSSNGVRFNRKRVSQVALGADTVVRLGSAKVRFVSHEAPVPKTTLFRVSRLDRWRAVAAGFVVLAVSTLFNEWYLKATRVRPSEVVETLVMLAVMLGGGWSFVWSLASRVAHGKSKVVGHLAAALFALGAMGFADRLPDYLASILRLGPTATDVLGGVCVAAVLGWLLFQNLSRVVSWSRRRLLVSVGVLLLLGAGLLVTAEIAEASKYKASLPLSSVQPPPALFIGPVDPDPALAARIAALKRQADAEKAEH